MYHRRPGAPHKAVYKMTAWSAADADEKREAGTRGDMSTGYPPTNWHDGEGAGFCPTSHNPHRPPSESSLISES